MADIKKLNEELQKVLGESTLGYLKKAEDAHERMKNIVNEGSSFSSALLEKAKQYEEILGHSNVPKAFQSVENFKDYIYPFHTAIEKHDFGAIQQALGADINSYLKPEYRATLEALDSVKGGLAYALAHNVDGIASRLETFRNTALDLKDEKRLLDAAKHWSTIASAIDSDIYKSQIDKLLDKSESSHAHIDSFTSQPSALDFKMTYMPPVFEDTPLGRQTQKLIEHSEQQTNLLKIMAEHLEKQKEHTDRQINLTNIQIQKAEEQVVSLKEQNEALNKQNEIISSQASSANRDASNALKWVKITLIISILSSVILYLFQDNSDEKNHIELINAINDKKVLESQLSQFQLQTANQNELVKLMKEQNSYLQQLQSQKKMDK